MNSYQEYISKFFTRIVELKHSARQINSVLSKSVKNYDSLASSDFISGSALVINDWTEPPKNSQRISLHTGISKAILKKDYTDEVKRIISTECCYAFAQSFEALEGFFKDCVFTKAQLREEYLDKVITKSKKGTHRSNLTRTTLPGGDTLFDLIKIACQPGFSKSSNKNNKNIKFKEFWTVLSEVRHSITHSSSILVKTSKFNPSGYHFKVFTYFFNYSNIDEEKILIELNLEGLDKVLKAISEFSFQIFKLLSIDENADWRILKE